MFKTKCVILIFLLLSGLVYTQDKINSYSILTTKPLRYEKIEFNIDISSSFINPYDQKEIALDMILSSPSGKQITLPCFFVSGSSASSSWKARFTAQETGNYSFNFRLSKSSKPVFSSQNDNFIVSESDKDGFLHINDYWTFKFDSGKLFRGIGENVGWESRSWENSKWTYDYLLGSLSKNRANFFRTWMCPWNLPVEWKQIKDTKRYTASTAYFNPSGINRMDQLINMAEDLNLYMMLTLDWHGAFITDDGWTLSNYNSANGGPASTPTEFFTTDAAKAQYKNRLRYLVARWGYSTSIGAWEFFNEIDNSAFNSSDVVRIPLSAVAQWHDEMSTYLKSIDPYNHLVTTSVSHRDITGMNSLKNLDFNQKHIYGYTSNIPSTIKTYVASTSKPYVIGEFGFRWEDDDPQYSADFNYDYKRGLWYGLFSPTPILPMSWWWELFDNNSMTPYIRSVRDISDQMLSYGRGSFKPFTVSAANLESYGMKCGDIYFVYILNSNSFDITVQPSFAVDQNTIYHIKSLSPSDFVYNDLPDIEVTKNRISVPNLQIKAKEGIVLEIGTGFTIPPAEEIPSSYSLKQNYPNPFNPGTTIEYSLPEDSKVKVSVYDILGKGIITLADKQESAGNKKIKFDASRLSSGIYMYSISAISLDGKNTFNKIMKMILVK